MGDLTTNHTGYGHDWFALARADEGNLEREFYLFDGDSYESWLGHLHLPKLDHRSAELARRLYDGPDSVVAHWLREGLDGWRVDVANMTGRLAAEDLAHQVARTVRRTVEETRPDGWLLAEHAHDASLDLDGTGWHGTMDYSGFTRPAWCWLSGPSGVDFMGLPVDVPRLPAEAVVATMRDVHAAMPWQSFTGSTMHLDSHDVARFRTVVGGGTDGWVDHDGLGRDRHLVGVALQMTMPGVPGGLRRRRDRVDRRRRRARPHAVPVAAARRVGRPDAGGIPHLDRRTSRARRPAPRRAAVAGGRR